MLTNKSRQHGPGTLQREIVFRRPESLRVNPRNARTHSKQQVRQIADSILAFGNLAPIAIDENGTIIYGRGRQAAASLLGLELVPTVTVTGLSEARKRAFAIADDKIAENAGWDRAILGEEFGDLIELLEPIGLDLTITGSAPGRSIRSCTTRTRPERIPMMPCRRSGPLRSPGPASSGSSGVTVSSAGTPGRSPISTASWAASGRAWSSSIPPTISRSLAFRAVGGSSIASFTSPPGR
jgi:hypothetical protein